jgi:hypothetical protein
VSSEFRRRRRRNTLDKTWESDFLSNLKQRLEQSEIKTDIIHQAFEKAADAKDSDDKENEGFDVLRSAYQFRENAGALLDTFFAPAQQEGVQLLKLYFLLTDKMGDSERAKLFELIRVINANLPLGDFGVHEGAGQLYYTQSVLFADDTDMEAALKQVLYNIESMLIYIDHFFDALMEHCK